MFFLFLVVYVAQGKKWCIGLFIKVRGDHVMKRLNWISDLQVQKLCGHPTVGVVAGGWVFFEIGHFDVVEIIIREFFPLRVDIYVK